MSYLCGFVVLTSAWAAAEVAAGVLAWLVASGIDGRMPRLSGLKKEGGDKCQRR